MLKLKKMMKIKKKIKNIVSNLRNLIVSTPGVGWRIASVFIIAIIIVIGLLYIFNKPAAVEAGWYNDGWMYRQTITITNGGSAQTDFQIEITDDTAALVTAGKLQSDCDDIRLTDINGNVLYHWIEDDTCNTVTTNIWTKLASIPTTATTLYMYYGNPSATNVESGSNIFMFFDDFEDANFTAATWTGTGTGFTVIGGQLYHSNTLEPTNSFPTYTINNSSSFNDGIIHSKMKPTSCGSSYGKSLVARYTDDNNLYIAGLEAWGPADQTHIGKRVAGTWTNLDKDVLACSTSTWYDLEWSISGTSQTLIANAITSVATDSSFSSGNVGVSVDNKETATGAYWEYFFVRKYTATEPVAGSPASEEKGSGPVAYWKFDEGYGTTTHDATTSSHNGTLTSGPTWQSEDMCVSGKCLKFDGVNDYVSIGIGSDYLPLDTFSICAWVKSPGLAAGMTKNGIFSLTYGLSISLNSSGLIETYMDNGTTIVSGSAGSNLYDNNWHHVCMAYDGANQHIYADGIEKASLARTWLGTTRWPTNGVNVGHENNNPPVYKFNGFIDEVKLYNYNLTAAQVKADYLAGQSGAASGVSVTIGGGQQSTQSEGLVVYYAMDASSGTSVADSSGNGLTATTYNMVNGDWQLGKYGNSLHFTRAGTDYVATSATTLTNFTKTDPFTVSAWVYNDSVSGTWHDNTIVATTNCSDQYKGWSTSYSDTSQFVITLGYNDGSWHSISAVSDNTYSLNTWYFVTFVMAGTAGEQKIYVNGEEVATTLASNTDVFSYSGAQVVSIGKRGTCGDSYMDGKIDDLKIYNVARTAEQIMRDYKTGPGPVAYYDFETGGGTTLYDRSTNGYTSDSFGGSPAWTLGKYGSALDFDTTDYARNNSFSIGSDPVFTVTGWFKRTASTTTSGAWGIGAGGVSQQTISGYNNSGERIGIDSWGTSTYYVADEYPLNDWVYVSWIKNAATFTQSTVEIYVNGIKKSLSTLRDGVDTVSLSSGLTLGGIQPASNYSAPMIMDDFKIYNYARTKEQILWDMYGDNDAHPISYWNFDEGYGTQVKDIGFGNNDGTISGTTWTSAGKISNALSFNSTDYVSCGTQTDLIFGAANHSFTAWVKPSALTGAYNYIIAIGNNANGEQSGFGVASNGNLFHSAYSSPLVTFGTSISTGNWYHLSLVHNNGVSYAYVNGELAESQTIATNVTTGKCYIGAHTAAASTFNDAIIDEVKIFNFALSPEQIRQEYNQGSQVSLGKQKDSSSTWDDGGFGGDAPIGYWNFEEGSGSTVYDKSSNSNNLTNTGADYGLGKFGWGGDFEADNSDYIYTSDSSSFTGGSATLEAWIKPESYNPGSGRGIISKGAVSNREFHLRLGDATNNDKLQLWVSTDCSSPASTVSGNTAISLGTWSHVVGTYDGETMRIYINGYLDGVDTTPSGSMCNGAADINIGRWAEGGWQFDGLIDEVKIFSYARTQAQIAYDYNGGKPVGWWPLDNGEGIIATDVSGNGNDGTLTSMDPTADWLDGTSCRFEGCLDFDGSNDYVDLGNVVDLDFDYNQPHTIAAWVKTSYTGSGTIFSKMDNTVNYRGYDLWLNSTHTLASHVISTWNTEALKVYGTTNINDNVWHHLVATYDGSGSASGLILYVDGVIESVTTEVDGLSTTTKNSVSAKIGSRTTTAGAPISLVPELIDDVRVYNYALTADQIKEVMNNGSIYIK